MICLHNSEGGGVEQDLTQLAVIMLCDGSTGCDDMNDYFETEAETMIDTVCEVGLNKGKLFIFTFNRNIY